MRIKCPHCNGKWFSEINSALNLTCGWCMGQGELDLEIVPTEQTTNEDFLRTATTEQLAELLNTIINRCYECGGDSRVYCCPFGDCECNVVEWLKQPYQGAGNE